MEDEIKQDRSPRSPNTNLSDALEQVRKLHAQIGRAKVKPDSAAVALGYKGANNGAALTTFATLSQYGLIERSKGEISITPLAVRIMHATGEEQRRASLREAALNPPIMADIHENFGQLAPEVLANHLVQQGFTPDRAKRTAEISIANKGFAHLGETEILTPSNAEEEGKASTDKAKCNTKREEIIQNRPANMLAQYIIPLGPNEATLVFTGNELTLDDFDALIDFVEFSKRQFERAEKSKDAIARLRSSFFPPREPVASPPDKFPAHAVWRNKDHDKPVTITGVMGEQGGVTFYQSSEGTGIPAHELDFSAAEPKSEVRTRTRNPA